MKKNILSLTILLALLLTPAYAEQQHVKESQIGKMRTHVVFEDVLSWAKTERKAYEALKENPLDLDIDYLVVPWAEIFDTMGRPRGLAEFHRRMGHLRFDNGFTVCASTHFPKVIPLLKSIGVTTVFTSHLSNRHHYNGITLLPFPHYPMNSAINPDADKWIRYSYVGATTHRVRRKILQLPKQDDVVIKCRSRWHYWLSSKDQQKLEKEYIEILEQSRFVLCPRGSGPNSFRIWEGLQAGAIPIVISDEKLRFPDGFDWNSCIICIGEDQVTSIDKIIDAISPEQEELIRAQCLKAYNLFFRDFSQIIHNHFQA